MPLTAPRLPSARALRVLVGALATAVAVGASAQALERVAGDVEAVANGTLRVHDARGEVKSFALPASARVTVRLPASWSDIAKGSYVGSTAVPQADGTLLAKEVHIFTEAQRGTGEGHYPMATPGDTMTNATVSAVAGGGAGRSTMTNATVAASSAGNSPGERRLTLTYKGGEKTIVVPEGTPIVKSEPGDASLLVPGAHVLVYARRGNDGALAAERVSVGRGGFVPPI